MSYSLLLPVKRQTLQQKITIAESNLFGDAVMWSADLVTWWPSYIVTCVSSLRTTGPCHTFVVVSTLPLGIGCDVKFTNSSAAWRTNVASSQRSQHVKTFAWVCVCVRLVCVCMKCSHFSYTVGETTTCWPGTRGATSERPLLRLHRPPVGSVSVRPLPWPSG